MIIYSRTGNTVRQVGTIRVDSSGVVFNLPESFKSMFGESKGTPKEFMKEVIMRFSHSSVILLKLEIADSVWRGKSLGLALILKGGPGSGSWEGPGKKRTKKQREAAARRAAAKRTQVSPDKSNVTDSMKDIYSQLGRDLGTIGGKNPVFTKVEGKMSSENAKLIADNMKKEIDRYGNYLAGDTMGLMRDYLDHNKELMKDPSLSHMEAATMNTMMIDSVRKLVYQEIESNRLQFTDHGIRHIVGNIKRQSEIMDAMSDKPVSAMDKLVAQFIMVNHDIGYTTSGVRAGGEEGIKASYPHQANGAKILSEQKALWNANKVFTSEQFDNAVEIVRTHDSTKLDRNDIIGTATRLSDNLSLFAKDKLPSMFKNVKGGKMLLTKMGEASEAGNKNRFNLYKGLLTRKIDASDMSSFMKRDLKAAVKEISYKTPRFTMGLLAGEISKIKREQKKIMIDINHNSWDAFLQKHFDMGQKQTKKLLSAYGIKDYNKTEYDLGGIFTIRVNKKGRK